MSEVSVDPDDIRAIATALDLAVDGIQVSLSVHVGGTEMFGDARLAGTVAEFATQWERENSEVRAELLQMVTALRRAADAYESNEESLAAALGGLLLPPAPNWQPKGRAAAV